MMSALLTAFLLMGTTVPDTLQVLPLPLSVSSGDSTSPVNRLATDSSDALSQQPVTPDFQNGINDTSKVTTAVYPVHVFRLPEGFNLETTESDVIDGFDDEEPVPVLLNRDESTGIGSLIPGSILTTIGVILTSFSLISYRDDPSNFTRADRDLFSGSGSAFMISGSIVTLSGAFRLSRYIRSYSRYKPAGTGKHQK